MAPSSRSTRSGEGGRLTVTRFRARLALMVGLAVAFIGAWTRLPAPTYAFLFLSVGAPEVSHWLLLAAAFAASLALVDAARLRLARAALIIALLASIPPALVLVQIPGTTRAFEAALADALGADWLSRVPADVRRGLRPEPVEIGELFGGLETALTAVRVFADAPVAVVEGQSLTATVYRPADDRRVPVVVQIYGGAWRSGAPRDDAALARALASAGFAVFAIDYRHAPRWQWPAQLDDVRAGIQWAADHAASYGADASRMALVGRSAGAQLAMLAPHRGGPPIAAVVSCYGPVDLADGYRHPPRPDPLDIRAVESALIGGTPDDRPDAYRDASPISFAGRPHPPTLLIAAGRDHIVEPRFSRRLHEALSRSGTSVLLTIPWADHRFDAVPGGPSSQLALYNMERFLAWALWRD